MRVRRRGFGVGDPNFSGPRCVRGRFQGSASVCIKLYRFREKRDGVALRRAPRAAFERADRLYADACQTGEMFLRKARRGPISPKQLPERHGHFRLSALP